MCVAHALCQDRYGKTYQLAAPDTDTTAKLKTNLNVYTITSGIRSSCLRAPFIIAPVISGIFSGHDWIAAWFIPIAWWRWRQSHAIWQIVIRRQVMARVGMRWHGGRVSEWKEGRNQSIYRRTKFDWYSFKLS